MNKFDKYTIEVLNGNVPITETVKNLFNLNYKKLLNEGYYIVRNKEGIFRISNKKPEKNEKQKANYDEFIKNIFIEI